VFNKRAPQAAHTIPFVATWAALWGQERPPGGGSEGTLSLDSSGSSKWSDVTPQSTDEALRSQSCPRHLAARERSVRIGDGERLRQAVARVAVLRTY